MAGCVRDIITVRNSFPLDWNCDLGVLEFRDELRDWVVSRNRLSSISIITATLVIGLVMDARRKMASGRMGFLETMSITPWVRSAQFFRDAPPA